MCVSCAHLSATQAEVQVVSPPSCLQLLFVDASSSCSGCSWLVGCVQRLALGSQGLEEALGDCEQRPVALLHVDTRHTNISYEAQPSRAQHTPGKHEPALVRGVNPIVQPYGITGCKIPGRVTFCTSLDPQATRTLCGLTVMMGVGGMSRPAPLGMSGRSDSFWPTLSASSARPCTDAATYASGSCPDSSRILTCVRTMKMHTKHVSTA